MFAFYSENVEQTEQAAALLGATVEPGTIVALIGDLGAGKTAFTRGLALGLEVPYSQSSVTSPTFVLIQEYEGRMPLFHFDTYRLPNVESFTDLGVDEYFTADGVSVIEWADRVTEILPGDRLEIQIIGHGPEQREVRVNGAGPRSCGLGERWRQRLCDAGVLAVEISDVKSLPPHRNEEVESE